MHTNENKNLTKKFRNRRYTVQLNGLREGDSVLVPVSINKEYFKGSKLGAIVSQLHQATRGKKIFLVAGRLQRHTLMMFRLPSLLRLERALIATTDMNNGVPLSHHDDDVMSIINSYVEPDLVQDFCNILTYVPDACTDIPLLMEKYKSKLVEYLDHVTISSGSEWRGNFKGLLETLKQDQQDERFSSDLYFGQFGRPRSGSSSEDSHDSESDEMQEPVAPVVPPAPEGSQGEYYCFQWSEFTHTSLYTEMRDMVNNYYDYNGEYFANIVNETAESFVDYTTNNDRIIKKYKFPSQDDPDYAIIHEQALALSVEYILEESAVFAMVISQNYSHTMAYPFQENESNTKLYDCIVKLISLVSQKRRRLNKSSAEVMRPVHIEITDRKKAKKAEARAKQKNKQEEDHLTSEVYDIRSPSASEPIPIAGREGTTSPRSSSGSSSSSSPTEDAVLTTLLTSLSSMGPDANRVLAQYFTYKSKEVDFKTKEVELELMKIKEKTGVGPSVQAQNESLLSSQVAMFGGERTSASPVVRVNDENGRLSPNLSDSASALALQ